MTRALIAGAAPSPDHGDFYRSLLSGHDPVIAADAAGEWCVGLGRVPDVTVGDFDSSAPGAAQRLRAAGSRVIELPADKDLSDLDACVLEARRLGATEVTFTAAYSLRIDHTLAALGTLMAVADLDAVIEEPTWWGRAVAGGRTLALQVDPGSTFTVLAPGGATGVSIGGARYAMSRGTLEPLSSRGSGNVATASKVTIRAEEGMLLVIVLR